MSTVKVTTDGAVATVTLARPERRNALNAQLVQDLNTALDALRSDAMVRAIVLTGEGQHFCAGGDVASMQGGSDASALRARMLATQRACTTLAMFDRPVIAAVDGAAFGAGFSLALHADFVVASERARFCLAFARIGLVPDLAALHTLPRMIGVQRARELIYSAREIDAREAQALGLVLDVVPADALAACAQELAQSLATQSSVAFSMTKQMLSQSFEQNMAALLDAEANAQVVALSSPYVKEAAARFERKEAPLFQWPLRETKRA